jgi:hypothetical protein
MEPGGHRRSSLRTTTQQPLRLARLRLVIKIFPQGAA